MKNKTSSTLFMASMLVGILITITFNLNSVSGMFNVNEYDEIYNERLKLYSNLNTLKEQYEELEKKVNTYEKIKNSSYKITRELEKELFDMKAAQGLTEVEGTGVRITLKDSDMNGSEVYTGYQLIHDSDIRMMINDLKNAGAEAIAINGQRIVYDTYTYCSGVAIDVGGIKVVTPFYIEAIGDSELIKSYFTLNDSQYKKLLARKINVDVEKVDNLILPEYKGKIAFEHMSNIEK